MSSQRASARNAIATIGRALAGESPPVMFVGGTVTALYPLEGGMALRPTLDVDCVVDLATTADYYASLVLRGHKARGVPRARRWGLPGES